MASYPAEWLALREPADHAARNRHLLKAVAASFQDEDSLSVVDLACGTGSTLRACAPMFPSRQAWTLVDHDPLLLAAAGERLSAWADHARQDGDALLLEHRGKTITVRFRQFDLTRGVTELLDTAAQLVTASALFDLVSVQWIVEMVGVLKGRALPIYAAITYTGQEWWRPPHPSDAAINAAFLAHQRQVKAFGPGAGPDGAARLASALEEAGYAVELADSAWLLSRAERDLTTQVIDGIAGAALETGLVDAATTSAWVAFRKDAIDGLGAMTTIGNVDLWGAPTRS